MSKMSTDPVRHALNGPTMGTRWSALFFAAPGFDVAPVQAALQQAVEEVDSQMSTWNPDSDLMRLNAAPVGEWVRIPARLAEVICGWGSRSGAPRAGPSISAWATRCAPGGSALRPPMKPVSAPRWSQTAARRMRCWSLTAYAPASTPRSRSTSMASPRDMASTGWPRCWMASASPTPSLASTARCAHWPAPGWEAWTIAIEPRTPTAAPPFDPCAARRRRGHIRRLSPLGQCAGPPPIAHDGPCKRARRSSAPPPRSRSLPAVARKQMLGQPPSWLQDPKQGQSWPRRHGLDVLFLSRDAVDGYRALGSGRPVQI